MYEIQERCAAGFWWGHLRERDHLEDLVLGGSIILKLIFKKWDGEARTGFLWLRIRTGGGACEYEYEHPGSIKYGDFLDSLRNCQLLKKNNAQ